MVVNGAIDMSTIIGAILGFAGKVLYDEVTRWRQNRAEEKQSKIEWYEQLSALSKEVKMNISARKSYIEELEARTPKTSESGSVAEELEDAEEKMDWLVDVDFWLENRRGSVDDIKTETGMMEERVRQHFVQYPDDVDAEIVDEGKHLLTQLMVVSSIGAITDKVEAEITATADTLIDDCGSATQELEKNVVSRWLD